jgi:3-deoxy-manno-octulosonate cytidylyltransferase (CMP-KDO synthetase)
MPRKENIVAIIPARYGSTRLPAKPLLDLAGKPMIQHVYERTKKAKLVEQVIVATDDERVLRAVQAFHGEVVMTPRDVRSGSDRVAVVARDLPNASIIVNVQGDEPLIEPAMIDEAIRPLVDDETILVGTLVKRIDAGNELTNPNIVKAVLDTNGFAMYFSRAAIPYGSIRRTDGSVEPSVDSSSRRPDPSTHTGSGFL